MTLGVVKSQGSELFVVETASASDPTITKFVCPTGISGLGGPKDEIETTCLDTTDDKTYVPGLGTPGEVSVPFNFVPRDGSHQFLFVLKDAGTVMHWLVGLSESSTDPTMDTDLEFVAPSDRTSFRFDAFIKDVNIDVASNAIVKGTMTLKRSGAVKTFFFSPT